MEELQHRSKRMNALSQKNAGERAGERAITRGKSLTAVSSTPTIEPSKEAWEITLTTIMTRLEKLEKLDRLDEIDNKLNVLPSIQEKFEKLTQKTESFIRQTRDDLDTLAGIVETTSRQQDTLTRANTILEHQLNQTVYDNKMLQNTLNEIENKSKESNLRLEGKREEDDEDLLKYVLDMANRMTNGLETEAITAVYRLGKKHQQRANARATARPRTILISFRSVQDRNTLYYARTKLRDCDEYKNIYINDDVTAMTRKVREDYRAVAAIVRSSGTEVRIHDDGIVIDGKKYKYGQADQLPKQFSIQRAKMIKIEEGIYFQSSHAFLSNFHPSPIIIDGNFYPTAEHKLQADKSLMAGDIDRNYEIMRSRTPLEAKRIGDQIPESQEWRQAREDNLRAIIDLKFDQNKNLAKRLIRTRQLSLHEATGNTYYGIGATLNSRELRNKQFTGQNKLGLALEEKRARLVADQEQVNNKQDG